MAILDTDLLVARLRHIPAAIMWIENHEGDETFCVTPIQILELFKGAYLSNKRQQNAAEIQKLIASLEILPITVQSAEVFGKLFSTLQEEGKMIGEFDLIIASVAINNGQSVVTRNISHFDAVLGLVVVKW